MYRYLFLRALFVTLTVDIVSSIINLVVAAGFALTYNIAVLIIGIIIIFVIALIIYKYLFDMDWIKTFVMLIIAGVILLGIMAILALIFAAIGFLALGNAFSSLSAAP